MEALQHLLRSSHIWAGFALLALFWIPLFVKKGSRGHIIIGRIYTWLMFGVLFTAASLCVYRVATGNWSQGLALGFLTLISFNALWYGYVVAINKKLTKGIATTRSVLSLTTVIYGVALTALGIYYSQMLFVIFGTLGFLPSIFALVNRLRGIPKPKFNWLREHYSNMIISGGAAYTAFLAFGARMFFQYPDNTLLGILPWVLPTVLALFAVGRYNKQYSKK